MVRALVYPEVCRGIAEQQACFCSCQDQARGARRPLCSRSIPVRQQTMPRTHHPSAPQERKPHSVLESFCPRTSIHGRYWARDHRKPRTPSSIAGTKGPRRGELPALVEQALSPAVQRAFYRGTIEPDFRQVRPVSLTRGSLQPPFAGVERINRATSSGSSICTKWRAVGSRNRSDVGNNSWNFCATPLLR